jgi:uncharacterized membrane-anchored protein
MIQIRRLVVLVAAVLVLAIVNFEIYKKEQLLVKGQTVLIRLVPRDPRSLMQGDYMVLRYQIARILPELNSFKAKEGYLVIELDDNQVAQFKRVYDKQTPLGENELLLQFRKRRYQVRIGAESFFFQEGHAKYYNNARYGELRVAPSGKSVLVGLRDAEFKQLGQKMEDKE